MVYEMFDLYIEINEIYDETRLKLQNYLAKEYDRIDFTINISDEEIDIEKKNDPKMSNAYHEMICILRHIAEEVVDFDAMFLHSAIVKKDDFAYAFLGHSGSGKSTHAMEWVKYFGESATIINGDKPVVRFLDDGIYAYGSPWCGVEGFNVNTKAKLKAACFIKKATKNEITALDSKEVFNRILDQTVIPKKAKRRIRHFELVDRLIKEIRFYNLDCDISKEAVATAYNEMRGEKF